MPRDDREQRVVMSLPDGSQRSFDTLVELAQRCAANAIGKPESEWVKNGRMNRRYGVGTRPQKSYFGVG
jgi:hypothetical protein